MTLPTTVKLPEASSFALLTPLTAKYNTPALSLIVQVAADKPTAVVAVAALPVVF